MSEDEWTIFENTHEPIIVQQTLTGAENPWECQALPDGWGEQLPHRLCYCTDCSKMYISTAPTTASAFLNTLLVHSSLRNALQDQHRINEDVVLSLVSEMLKAIAEYAAVNRAESLSVWCRKRSQPADGRGQEAADTPCHSKAEFPSWKSCLCKIYEDNIFRPAVRQQIRHSGRSIRKEQSRLTR